MVELNIALPEGFLDEEVRCGYKISKEMKKVWAVELDLLVKFQHICDKYSLQYTLSGGSLLGVIRHHGFIPWDDDIDVDMPASDYRKLCEVAKKEFEYPYFFQTEYTDRNSNRGHAQIRRTDTTAILSSEENKKINQGIFIDVFPIYNIPDDKKVLDKQVKKIQYYKKVISRIKKLSNIDVIKKEKRYRALKCIIYPIFSLAYRMKIDLYLYKKMEDIAYRYNNTKTKRVAGIIFLPVNEKIRFSSQYLLETSKEQFEFITVKITKKYDEILKQMYGNYMEYVIGNSLHGSVVFDTDHTYKDYIK